MTTQRRIARQITSGGMQERWRRAHVAAVLLSSVLATSCGAGAPADSSATHPLETATASLSALAPARRIKDINLEGPRGGFDPAHLFVAGGKLYFDATAGEDDTALGLWQSDGTPAGTLPFEGMRLVSEKDSPRFRRQHLEVGGALYFAALGPTPTGNSGSELWRTDGTQAGTVLIKDIAPGSASSTPAELAELNGVLFFRANDRVHGEELWKSDGTPEGTVLVKDLRSGPEGSQPTDLIHVGGTLFFTADDGVHGRELWKSDGTPGGTVLVKDLLPGAQASSPLHLVHLNGLLYFAATSAGDKFANLWRSDGTPEGTVRLKDLWPALQGVWHPENLLSVKGTLFFTTVVLLPQNQTAHQLWRTDGTEAGTFQLLAPGNLGTADNLVDAEGRVFLRVDGALWMTDGTQAGTVKVRSVSGIDNMTSVRGGVFFSGDIYNGHGKELWWSDGTAAGTFMVKDLVPGPESPRLYNAVNVGGTLFFLASNPSTHRWELWKSDGTEAGTQSLTSLLPRVTSSDPQCMTSLGGVLYFYAYDREAGLEPWRSDGTEAGTSRLADIFPGTFGSIDGIPPAEQCFRPYRGELYFSVAGGGGIDNELFKTDGTTAGTKLLKDIFPGGAASPGVPIEFNGLGYFPAYSSHTVGRELWRTDGTEAGTQLAMDFLPGQYSFNPGGLTVRGDRLFFNATDGIHGAELWKSDGTREGTELVKDIRPGQSQLPGGASSNPNQLSNQNGTLYFLADDGEHGIELWRSDGTTASTWLLEDIAPGPPSSSPQLVANIQGTLFLVADDGVHGVELWKTDGTKAGTTLVKDIHKTGSALPWSFYFGGKLGGLHVATLDGVLYFLAADEAGGRELWRSDGTEAGTFRVKDILPGPGDGAVGPMLALEPEGLLLFAATDGVSGVELWQSDGTEAGTQRAADIRPGARSSYPKLQHRMGDTVFFSATDGTGFEPWSATVQAAPRPPPPLAITCPGNVLVEMEHAAGTGVTWPDATLVGSASGSASLTYSQLSGTQFPLGSTAVTARATDGASGHAVQCSFLVTLVDPTGAPELPDEPEDPTTPKCGGCSSETSVLPPLAWILLLVILARRSRRLRA